jgi:hypothetical protein
LQTSKGRERAIETGAKAELWCTVKTKRLERATSDVTKPENYGSFLARTEDTEGPNSVLSDQQREEAGRELGTLEFSAGATFAHNVDA